MQTIDLPLLHCPISLAASAHGNHPFGALLVNKNNLRIVWHSGIKD